MNCCFYIKVRHGLMEEHILYELIPCINKAYDDDDDDDDDDVSSSF